MGITKFLKEKGFIKEDTDDKPKQSNDDSSQQIQSNAPPAFFPVTSFITESTTAASDQETADPSFVTPLPKENSEQQPLDPAFVKFFEDELVKANLPGPDYFEFRQLLLRTQQKMAAKGVVAPDVVLQTVIMSFDAQDISSAKLVESAKHYKEVLKQKSDDFLKGAATEKNNQLQKRQTALQAHEESVRKLQQQIQQLEAQKQQLEESLKKAKTGMEVDKSLGKEGIEKIEKAERLLSLAHTYIQSSIEGDIKRLQSI